MGGWIASLTFSVGSVVEGNGNLLMNIRNEFQINIISKRKCKYAFTYVCTHECQ